MIVSDDTVMGVKLPALGQGHQVVTTLGVDEEDLVVLERAFDSQGIVFQDFRLLDHMTTYENVALPFRVMGKDEETGVIGSSAIDTVAVPLFGGMLKLINLAKDFSPVDALSART